MDVAGLTPNVGVRRIGVTMTTWTVKEPGKSYELTTEELGMRALARKI